MQNGKSILKLLGTIFASIAIGGIALSIILLLIPAHWVAVLCVGCCSAAFLIPAVVCLSIYNSQKSKKEKLMANNLYVMADIIDIDIDVMKKFTVDQIELNPYVIKCQYTEPGGKVHTFKSRSLLYNPSGLLKDNQLKVYVDPKNYKKYYMDTSSILPDDAVLHKFKFGWNAEELKQNGKYLTATTCGVELVGRITVSGVVKPTFLKLTSGLAKQFGAPLDSRDRVFLGYTVLCRFVSPDGKIHIFASKGQWGEPTKNYQGDLVKVYYKGNDYKHYYVDLDSIEVY